MLAETDYQDNFQFAQFGCSKIAGVIVRTIITIVILQINTIPVLLMKQIPFSSPLVSLDLLSFRMR